MCTCIIMCVYMCIHVHMDMCVYVCMCVSLYVCACVYACLCPCVHTYVCVPVYLHVFTYVYKWAPVSSEAAGTFVLPMPHQGPQDDRRSNPGGQAWEQKLHHSRSVAGTRAAGKK